MSLHASELHVTKLTSCLLLALADCSVSDRVLVWRATGEGSDKGFGADRVQQCIEALLVCASDLKLGPTDAPSRREYRDWQQASAERRDSWPTAKQISTTFGSWSEAQRRAGFLPDPVLSHDLRGHRVEGFSPEEKLEAIRVVAQRLRCQWFRFDAYYAEAVSVRDAWVLERRAGKLTPAPRLPLSQTSLQGSFPCWAELLWQALRPTDPEVLLEMSKAWFRGSKGWSDVVMLIAIKRAALDTGRGRHLTDEAYKDWVIARRERIVAAGMIATIPSYSAQKRRWGSIEKALIAAGLRVAGEKKVRQRRARNPMAGPRAPRRGCEDDEAMGGAAA